MPLIALMQADKQTVREIRDFPAGTVMKTDGTALPVVTDAQPAFNQKTQFLAQTITVTVGVQVRIGWTVTALPAEDQQLWVDRDALVAKYLLLQSAANNWGTLNAAQKDGAAKLVVETLVILGPPLKRLMGI